MSNLSDINSVWTRIKSSQKLNNDLINNIQKLVLDCNNAQPATQATGK